ncbi:ABC transporter ATP-binding protein [Rhizobiales bacterium]|uniref:ABC transporter ATP-binding protein n=1 Tax=Hongsoonwoonella zoysiae TaxID=2821844 RepID=UPI0015610DA1|nr:ABC transporter ATP-binding protein [Hongsoonwoonella zoysiae]NRG18813.1 ABC transporter ATP-binding protein [Hongsoonwoonella zoysiae]
METNTQTKSGPQAGTFERSGDLLLQAKGITKRFGEILANNDVSIDLRAGEIHALLGENGAGKSTLVKILYGALEPNDGTLLWRGKPVSITSPAEARKLGIGMVFQHFSLFEALTVAENIALAIPGKLSIRALSERIRTVSTDYGLELDPGAIVADLPVGIRQRVEIVRCLLQEPDLIIMDEPTSVLTPQETDQLFITLQRLTSEGCAILYISHRLEEVKQICHHATIMRHGEVVSECDPSQETPATLASMMVGAEIKDVRKTGAGEPGDERLVIGSLSAPADGPFGVALRDVNLAVRAGEVVAIAGIAANGQGELFDLISGERLADRADSVLIDGQAVGRKGVNDRRRTGAAFVPEERLGHGAVPGLKLSENIVLTRHGVNDGLVNAGFVNRSRAEELEKKIKKNYDVRMSHDDPEARSLSGGNLQKFVVGRELDRNPGVIVINQPTWGVDAGAAATIRQELIDLARAGSAVLVISQDLDEIFEVADRIAVISRGELSEAVSAEIMTRERIGLLMGGITDAHSAQGEGAAFDAA